MFTQHKEDEIILPFFKGSDISNLSFLDIGANDGKSFSNTWDLTLLGWKGCCVEPSPKAFSRLQENYKGNQRVHLFNYGISDKEGSMKFYESKMWVGRDDTPLGILSSLDPNHKNRFYGMEWEEIETNFYTFEHFLRESPIKKFDFISIDVEGHDLIVLEQMNLSELGCKLICLEYNQNEELANNFSSYCSKFGLYEIHRNVDNVIFSVLRENLS